MDPLTIAAVGSSVAGGLGSIFGRKRPKPPKELGEIARAVKAMAAGLPQSPEQLQEIARMIQAEAQRLGIPATDVLKGISSHYDAERVGDSADFASESLNRGRLAAKGLNDIGGEFSGMARDAGISADKEAEAARRLYGDGYLGVEEQAAQDALQAGSVGAQQERGRIAADRSEAALSAALGQQIEAARGRGVAPSAAAIINPAATAAGADVIARSAYDAEEAERRLGFDMRRGLLGTADRIAGRAGDRESEAARFGGLSGDLLQRGAQGGIELADAASAALRRSAAFAGDSQKLNLVPDQAEHDFTRSRNIELARGFESEKSAYNSKLDENAMRARLYQQSFGNFQGKHTAATDYWKGRTSDLKSGFENLASGLGKFNFGGTGGGSLGTGLGTLTGGGYAGQSVGRQNWRV